MALDTYIMMGPEGFARPRPADWGGSGITGFGPGEEEPPGPGGSGKILRILFRRRRRR